MDRLWSDKNYGYFLISAALQPSSRFSQTTVVTKLKKSTNEIGQCSWCDSALQSGGPRLVHCSSINTCSKDSPLILPGRQADREIDDSVGKWQPGEKLTCKWWIVRERRRRRGGGGERFSVCASVDASRGDVCGVSSWQLSSYTTCLPGKERGKPLLSPPFRTASHWPPDAVAMALGCSGNWRTHFLTGRGRKPKAVVT